MTTWNDLAAVAGQHFSLSLAEALRCWKHRGILRDLLLRAATDKYLREAARRAKVTIALEDLQAAADRYRTAHGLHSAERTATWLRSRGLTVDDLETVVERELIVARLIDRVPVEAIQAHFDRHRAQFARVRVGQLTVASEGAAQELLTQLTEEGADFAELARTHSLDPAARTTGGDLGTRQRRTFPAALAEAIFAAAPGQVIGPLKTERDVHLFHIAAFLPPELDALTARTIRQQLFDAWLRHEIHALQLTFPVLDQL